MARKVRVQKKSKGNAPDGFPEKAWNKLGENWRDAAQSKQTEDLEKDIIKAVREMAHVSHEMKEDNKLEALIKEARERKSFYTETLTIEKAKIDFCVYLMNTRGVKVSKDTQDAVDDVVEDEDEEDIS